MPDGGKSFQQAYNVQAGVDAETMLVVTEAVTPHANDKQEIEPALKALEELAEPLGQADALLADNGYYSEANVRACEAAGVTPYIAMGRERHRLPVEQRWTPPPPFDPDAGPVEAMAHRLSTLEGRAIYAQRKSTVEPVFRIIKSVLGFRQFHLRGLDECLCRMDAGQHGLESEAALQSLPASLIAERRSGFQILLPVEKTLLRMPVPARKCRISAFPGASSPNRPANVQSSIRRPSTGAFKSDRLLGRGMARLDARAPRAPDHGRV